MERSIRSIVELLYESYTEENPIETEEICADFRKIDQTIEKLSVQENDRVFTLVCQLCAKHERQSFIEGVRVGARLLLELIQPVI